MSLLFCNINCNVKEFSSFSYELRVNFIILIIETHIMMMNELIYFAHELNHNF